MKVHGLIKTLKSFFSLALNSLRLIFKGSTGRNIRKLGKFVVKIYEDKDECLHEYERLTKVMNANPKNFRVPKIYKIVVRREAASMIMEQVEGKPLDNLIIKFLLFKDPEAHKVFYILGKALRELHTINSSRMVNCFISASQEEIVREVSKLAKSLAILGIIDQKTEKIILSFTNSMKIAEEVLSPAFLHGEFYFTHILLLDNELPIFLDFHNSCDGPRYYDLSMLGLSLHVSLLFPSFLTRKLKELEQIFLTGYYGKAYNDNLLNSIRLTMLYLALRELMKIIDVFNKSLLIERLILAFKIRRLKYLINGIIYSN